MKKIADFISEIKTTYQISTNAGGDGVCELCGYNTSIVSNSSIRVVPYKDQALSICSWCNTAAEKAWVGSEMADGSTAGRVHGMMMPDKWILNELEEDRLAAFLTKRLEKRLTGYSKQKQMVPQ